MVGGKCQGRSTMTLSRRNLSQAVADDLLALVLNQA